MSNVEVKITGLTETIAKLKTFTSRMINAELRRAVRAGLIPMREEARKNLEAHQLTGALYRSIHISVRGVSDARGGGMTGRVVNSAATFYGAFLEFGTRHQKGIRWMGRAFDAQGQKSINAFTASVKQSVDRLAQP